ncbi:transmembrane protein 255B-like isoform X2 [Acipenser ruthenus]|uniref:transmembrane protein 255B-like isoform X2 n=1 Tax=Acipenser ruthenus TaxID=7906 RepID=UPI00145A3FA0|nr:transmembrane protein 255B-like isoform X2 [Acipenser ruthenus]
MQQPTAPSTVDALDAAEQFAKRRRTALWFTIALLVLSLIILVLGLAAGTRTGNVDVAGYYPGIILVASIIFISIGVIAAFFCAIVDGVIAAEFIDRRPLSEGRCQFYSSGSGYAYDNYHTEVLCYTFSSKCKLRVKSNTCYCCDLYNCESPERYSKYYEYTGVSSCMDASHLYCLLWASVVLNVLGLFLGIVTAAILGAFKDIKPVTQINCSSAPPPHILYNPAQQVLTYAGFCPSNQALPAYPNYPLPVQHHSSFQVPSSADTPLPDDSQASSQASSSYVLSPNAPSLYTPPYNPGDKPPPYAS